MWILLLLLLPVWLVLAWIHLRIHRDRLKRLDAFLVAAPLGLSLLFGAGVLHFLGSGQGLWDEIMAALGAYLILAAGFGLGIAIRHFRHEDALSPNQATHRAARD